MKYRWPTLRMKNSEHQLYLSVLWEKILTKNDHGHRCSLKKLTSLININNEKLNNKIIYALFASELSFLITYGDSYWARAAHLPHASVSKRDRRIPKDVVHFKLGKFQSDIANSTQIKIRFSSTFSPSLSTVQGPKIYSSNSNAVIETKAWNINVAKSPELKSSQTPTDPYDYLGDGISPKNDTSIVITARRKRIGGAPTTGLDCRYSHIGRGLVIIWAIWSAQAMSLMKIRFEQLFPLQSDNQPLMERNIFIEQPGPISFMQKLNWVVQSWIQWEKVNLQ